MKYSIIIPVFNRPDEVEELLSSLEHQQRTDFEVIVVEDGSTISCKEVCLKHSQKLAVHYYEKSNSGPGQSRNYGVERANGEWIIILDSDVVVPSGYLEAIDGELESGQPTDAFGGPDRASDTFSPKQKAISYSMTSFFTTGGIRGGRRKLDRFYPRSFNMGIRKEAFLALKGFSNMRFGEDIDFSIRVYKAGYRCRLFPQAWVWHKRRTDFKKFWKQVFNSGIARINLYKKYPESLKLVHLLPAVFTIGLALLALLFLFGAAILTIGNTPVQQSPGFSACCIGLGLPTAYALLILTDALLRTRSLGTSLLAVASSFIQLTGYGTGFLSAMWKRMVLQRGEYHAYDKTFYD